MAAAVCVLPGAFAAHSTTGILFNTATVREHDNNWAQGLPSLHARDNVSSLGGCYACFQAELKTLCLLCLILVAYLLACTAQKVELLSLHYVVHDVHFKPFAVIRMLEVAADTKR